jgi:hypothetical protein
VRPLSAHPRTVIKSQGLSLTVFLILETNRMPKPCAVGEHSNRSNSKFWGKREKRCWLAGSADAAPSLIPLPPSRSSLIRLKEAAAAAEGGSHTAQKLARARGQQQPASGATPLRMHVRKSWPRPRDVGAAPTLGEQCGERAYRAREAGCSNVASA